MGKNKKMTGSRAKTAKKKRIDQAIRNYEIKHPTKKSAYDIAREKALGLMDDE